MSEISFLPVRRQPSDLAAQRVQVKAYPSPFHQRSETRWFPAGMTLDEGLAHCGLRPFRECKTAVWLQDMPVSVEHLEKIRPKPYTQVTIRFIPAGRTLRMVLIATASVAAAVVGQYYVGPNLLGFGTLGSAVTGATLSPATALCVVKIPLTVGLGMSGSEVMRQALPLVLTSR